MSIKTRLLKWAIKLTPNIVVIWIANTLLKGIADISDFNFDLDERKAYVQTTLYGEAEPIEIWVNGFTIVSEEESHRLIIQQAQSNRPWLNTILSRLTEKTWKIPAIPQYHDQIELVSELLEANSPDPEEY